MVAQRRPRILAAEMERPITEPIRRHHGELRPSVAALAVSAERMPNLSATERRAAVAEALEFLRGPLRLHAEAEERWLYPAVARQIGHPEATAPMVLDHRLLVEYVDGLAAADPDDVAALQANLYAVHALLAAHFRKEEEVYLPLLEYEDKADLVGFVGREMALHESGSDGRGPQLEVDPDAPDFPARAGAAAKLAYLVRYAVQAPSSHNSQPWLFHLAGDTLYLHADRSRALAVVDPDDRALVISCGAALLHLRVAARHFGHELRVELLPDPGDEDLLARAELVATEPATYEEKLLFWAISHRRTNRHAFEPRPLPAELTPLLEAAAAEEGAWLAPLAGEAERTALCELVAEGDRRQLKDSRFRRELASWLHPTRTKAHDGMPAYEFGIPALLSTLGPFAIRTFDVGKGVAARDRKLAEGSPALFVLGTAGDEPVDHLHAGRALARVLLRAAQDEVSASFLNQPVEVSELRPRVAEIAGREGHAQLVLRMGYGPPVQATPRRPVRDVLSVET
jgi:iron-sulfur cluster repair protein YtfE (RIC family)